MFREVCKARMQGWAEAGQMRKRVRNQLTQRVVAEFKRMLIIIITAVYLLSVSYVQVCAWHAQMPLAFTAITWKGEYHDPHLQTRKIRHREPKGSQGHTVNKLSDLGGYFLALILKYIDFFTMLATQFFLANLVPNSPISQIF